MEKQIGRGLAAFHQSRAEDMGMKAIIKPGDPESAAQPLWRTARSNADPGRQPGEQIDDAGHRPQIAFEHLVDAERMTRDELVAKWAAEPSLDIGDHRLHAQPDVAIDDLFATDRDAG